jgi:hypothetical protein
MIFYRFMFYEVIRYSILQQDKYHGIKGIKRLHERMIPNINNKYCIWKADNLINKSPYIMHVATQYEILHLQSEVPYIIAWNHYCNCQWHTPGRCFFPGTLGFSSNKTDRRNITEILFKVALSTITSVPPRYCIEDGILK